MVKRSKASAIDIEKIIINIYTGLKVIVRLSKTLRDLHKETKDR